MNEKITNDENDFPWLTKYTKNGLRESDKAFKLFRIFCEKGCTLKELAHETGEPESTIQTYSSKYKWFERRQLEIEYNNKLVKHVQEELLSKFFSKMKIQESINIDEKLNKIIIKVLDLTDQKIDSMTIKEDDKEDKEDDKITQIPVELQTTKLPSLLTAIEKLVNGKNIHYKNVLRQLGLEEVIKTSITEDTNNMQTEEQKEAEEKIMQAQNTKETTQLLLDLIEKAQK